ncbi:MAG: DUF1266 domain-containing protein [Verrucomicrobia bacterium]|nr:MAG: DUF1266 domain-containing protein [Verrucomicrobiota bacterium]
MRLMRHLRTNACVMLAIISASCVETEHRYLPLLPTEASYATPTPDQKLWALATCAILTASNRGRLDLLGGCERTPNEIKMCRETTLGEWWGVSDRADLLKSLTWIEEGGHRKGFDQMAHAFSALTPDQKNTRLARVADDNEKSNKVAIVLKYMGEYANKSLTAWDFDRYVALCGWGYLAGYLSEEEAWQHIMPAARLLQQTFCSWEDLGKNHVVGREFWSWQQTQVRGKLTRQCYTKLLTDPASPWVRLKWDMDLSPPKISTEPQSQPSNRTP